MEFKDYKEDGFYKAKDKGFIFTLSRSLKYGGFYVVAVHQTKDIVLNTLWIGEVFNTFELAVEFCESFIYTNYKCIGKDS